MTQRQLDRSVARATGESVDFIRHFGFSEVEMPEIFPIPPVVAQALTQNKCEHLHPNQTTTPARKAA